MRKNLAKHAAKKLPLAKRVLALCFALIFVCSCLLPAFANGAGTDFTDLTEDTSTVVEESVDTVEDTAPAEDLSVSEDLTVDDGVAALDDGFGVDTMDESFGVDDGVAALDDDYAVDDGASTLDDDPISQPVGGIDLPIAVDPTPVVDGTDTPKEGAVNVTTDKDGNIVYEYDTSDVTFDDDFVVSQPDGDHALDKVDAAFAIPTNTYRFWLSEKDSYDLAEIASDAAAADLTEDEYLSLHGESKGLFHMMYVADGANLADYKFTSPTSVDDPSGNSRTFAGWYTIDDLGDKHDFKFDDYLYTSKSKTVDVYAKWKDTTEEKYKSWYEKLVNASSTYTLTSLATEYFEDNGFKEYVATLSEDECEKLMEKLEEVDADAYADVTYEMEDEYGIALMSIGPETETNQKVVSVGGTAKLKSSYSGYGVHEWKSSNTKVATVTSGDASNENVQTAIATVTGVSAGTVVITHTYTPYEWSQSQYKYVPGTPQTDTITLQVTSESSDQNSSYYLYCYTLIPGKSVPNTGQKVDADKVWNGMGLGSVTGLGMPSTTRHTTGETLDDGYGTTAGVMITYPSTYPDITYGDKTYQYATTEEQKYKEGYYTITWFRVVQSEGANAGANGYNPTVNGKNQLTYHLDGRITLNEKDVVAVDFKLRDAGESNFVLVDPETYSKRVNVDTVLGELTDFKVPTNYESSKYPQSKTKNNGIEYIFDGWYDNEECTGEKVNFTTYKVEKSTIFYGKYVPKDTIEEDHPFITVEKRITGLTDESQIDQNFYVKVGNYYLTKTSASIEKKSDGTIVLRWTIPNAEEGKYDISEANEIVEGYQDPATSGFGESVDVKAKSFTVDEVERIDSCSNLDIAVGIQGEENFIFAVSENGSAKKNVVVSKEPLSLSQRKAVEAKLKEIGSTFKGQTTVFYSIKDNSEIVIDRTHLTYENGVVHIGQTSQWNKAVRLKYNINEGNNPEVTVTNDYHPNNSDLTITKTVTGLLGDREKQFNFTLSFDQTVDLSKNLITWKKSDGTEGTLAGQTYTFTLSHGQSIVFSGIPAGVTATVAEDECENYTAKYKIHNTGDIFNLEAATEGRSASVTIDATAKTIQFLNHNDAEPDMGVLLDTLPYLVILAVVVGGAVLLIARKHKHDDE